MVTSVVEQLFRLQTSEFRPSKLASDFSSLDDRSQEQDATADNYYYPDGAYYYVETTDDQE